ncbi:CHAT domain-containing protein [Xanthobacter autotrophicus]|uniref:CHAT domain-containing protein n=1 Tax=Xanthobacter autotrophicus TaxID=280 RepID=UPI0024A669B7|nr:CHAT domain-containing protein [Xanthobacter autotrophicus]MDI4656468.1 CHAT domain-containing protein [Xanthobacter autotrophicus]
MRAFLRKAAAWLWSRLDPARAASAHGKASSLLDARSMVPDAALRALEAALADPEEQVRIGAARAAPWLAPKGAAALLSARQAHLPEPLPVAEASILAIAIEWAGGDGVPLAARILETTPEVVEAATAGDSDHWERSTSQLVDRIARPGPFRLLQPFFVAHRVRIGPRQEQPDHDDEEPDASQRTARAARWVFKNACRDFSNFGNDEAARARLEAAFADTLARLDTGDMDGAVERLLASAITNQDERTRLTAQRMLAVFGTQAAEPLLAMLAEDATVLPGPEVMAQIAAEPRGYVPEGATSARLCAFFACETLEDFTDRPTAFAVVHAALSGDEPLRLRAQRVTARMSADVALPVLVWCAIHGSNPSQRMGARILLDRILVGDRGLGIRFHRIGPTEVTPEALTWLNRIVRRMPERSAWTDNEDIALAVLAEAIAVLPSVFGGPGPMYKELGTAERLDDFIADEEAVRAEPHPAPRPAGVQASKSVADGDASFESAGNFDRLDLDLDEAEAEDLNLDLPLPASIDRAGAAAPLPAPAPRFTDLQLFDAGRELGSLEPLVHGRAYTLSIAVRALRLGLTKDSEEQPPVSIQGQTQTETVWVIVSDESTAEFDDEEGGAFEIDRRFASFRLPVTGDSQTAAEVKLTPRVKAFRQRGGGRGRIGIRLYHRLNLIDHLQLDLRLELQPGQPLSPPDDAALKVVICRAQGTSVEPIELERAARALNIAIDLVAGTEATYRFAVALGNAGGQPQTYATKRLRADQLDSFMTRFRNILLDAVFGEAFAKAELTPAACARTLTDLTRLGHEVMTTLFDYGAGGDFFSLGQIMLEALPQAPVVQIVLGKGAENLVLPWQILSIDNSATAGSGAAAVRPKPEDNLWGLRFVLEVKRCGDGIDPRPQAERDRRPIKVRYGNWPFANEEQHRARLAEIIAAHADEAVLLEPFIKGPADLFEVLKGGGQFIYLYAHGHAAAPATPSAMALRDLTLAKLADVREELKRNAPGLPHAEVEQRLAALQALKDVVGQGDPASALILSLATVRLTDLLLGLPPDGARLADAPILFLNTCQSAQLWNGVENSFVSFFLSRGARAIIGSEATIPAVFADRFGCEVVRRIFQGDTIGEAVRQARLTLLQASRNPLGLCYSVYGAGDARLIPPRAVGMGGP